MLEYIDIALLKSSIFLMVVLLMFGVFPKDKKNKGFKLNTFSIIIILVLPVFVIIDANSSEKLVYKNIDSFKDNHVLYCKEQGSKYRISIKDGWAIDKNAFYKDSLMIRADKCLEM